MADIFIGLDPSLTGFGVAAVGPGYDRTWLISPKTHGVDRLLEIGFTLGDIFAEVGIRQIKDVALEDTVRASYSALVLGELAGIVKTTCHTILQGQAKYPLKVPPNSLKRYATGRGNAKKIEVILSVYKHWGREFRDDNEADAFVLAQMASGYAKTAVQRTVLEQLADPKFRDGYVL